MSLEIAIILILGFIVIYVIFIEIYSVLFRITGLTKEKARFQSISLLTNCGFTTGESEVVTQDPVRRKVAICAMITGYAFSVIIVSLIINLITKISDTSAENFSFNVALIIFGVFIAIIIVSQLPFVKKPFEKLIEYLAIKILRRNNKKNVITLLDNFGKDAIAEIAINALPALFENKTLAECHLRDTYSLNLLMVKRRGKVLDISADTMLQKNDIIVLFGSYHNIKDLFGKEIDSYEEILDTENKLTENVVELFDNYGAKAMAEVQINRLPEIFEKKTLFESGFKEKYHIQVLILKRNDIPLTIDKDTVIQHGDSMVVFGPYMNIKKAFLYDKEEEKEQD